MKQFNVNVQECSLTRKRILVFMSILIGGALFLFVLCPYVGELVNPRDKNYLGALLTGVAICLMVVFGIGLIITCLHSLWKWVEKIVK